MTDKILVFVTCVSLAEAGTIAQALLEERLVACATIGPAVRSRYRWQGKLEESTEIPLLLKTRQDRWPEVEAAVRRLHSYAVPEIVATPIVAGSAAYLDWLDECLATNR